MQGGAGGGPAGCDHVQTAVEATHQRLVAGEVTHEPTDRAWRSPWAVEATAGRGGPVDAGADGGDDQGQAVQPCRPGGLTPDLARPRSPRPIRSGGDAAKTRSPMRRPRTRRAVQPVRCSAVGSPPASGGAPGVTMRPRRVAPVRSRPPARAIQGAGGSRAGWTRSGSSRWHRAYTPAPRSGHRAQSSWNLPVGRCHGAGLRALSCCVAWPRGAPRCA